MNSSIHLSLNSKDQGHKTYQGYYRIYCCFNTPPPTGYIELILRCLPKFYSLLAHFAIGTYTYKINSLHYPLSYHVKNWQKAWTCNCLQEKTLPKSLFTTKSHTYSWNTILKKRNDPSSRPSSGRQLLLLMTLVVMFITFITSKAQDACTNNTTGNFLLQLAATSGFLLIADVIAVIQIFNLFTPVTHIELFGEDEF